MTLLFFSESNNGFGKGFQKSIEQVYEKTEIFRTIRSLSARLRYCLYDIIGLVIVIDNIEQLNKIMSLKEILMDITIIIILPEKNNKIISAAYSLRPKYLSFTDSDQSEITTIVSEIIASSKKKKTIFED